VGEEISRAKPPSHGALELDVGAACNNDCRHCPCPAEPGEAPSFEALAARVREARARGCERLLLRGGEPTLREDLPDLARLARSLGYRVVALDTNGRRLAYRDYAELLVAAGVDVFRVRLLGPDEAAQDVVTRVPGSFAQSLTGIRNLVALGAHVVAELAVTPLSAPHLPEFAARVAGLGVRRADLAFPEPRGRALAHYRQVMPRLSDAAPFVHRALAGLRARGVDASVRGMFPCFFTDPETGLGDLHAVAPAGEGAGVDKPEACRRCRYQECPGPGREYLALYGDTEFEARTVPDRPLEVKLEVAAACNLRCTFCYNQNSFAPGHERHPERQAPKEVFLRAIDEAARAGARWVRFTGGEPLLNPDLLELARHAKGKGLRVRLNTHGGFVTERNARELARAVDWALLPVHGWDEESDARVTGIAGQFERKCRAIRLLAGEGVRVVVDTVATSENIQNLERIAQVVRGLPTFEWFVALPTPWPDKPFPVSREEVEVLGRKLLALREAGVPVSLAHATPFCAGEVGVLRSVASGALGEAPHTALVVDPHGTVKAHYSMPVALARAEEEGAVGRAWSHPFAREVRNLRNLPGECAGCRFTPSCRGGSRFAAWLAAGEWGARDPLADPEGRAKGIYY
jgi:radical SAM protein with 4Fe4S-binding SPASM domain